MRRRTEADPRLDVALEAHAATTDDGCPILVSRRLPVVAGPPVLLVHGASAGSDTFLVAVPGRNGGETCCVEDLAAAGRDVWLLDWRGSKDVVDGLKDDEPAGGLTYDAAARYDLPAALRTVREVCGEGTPVDLVGHCMGGAVVAQALALGHVTAAEAPRVVLSALALFYRATIDRSLLVQNELAERLFRGNDAGRPFGVSPAAAAFPGEFEPLFGEVWQELPTAPRCELGICQRLSFLFGTPFETARLVPGVHTKRSLSVLFGTLATQLLLHGAQNIERGFAGPYRKLWLPGEKPDPGCGATDNDYLAHPERFRDVAVTLVTGARNRVWHRDGIDLMHEWLTREAPGGDYERVVVESGGHQDLFWGTPYVGTVRDVLLHRLAA